MSEVTPGVSVVLPVRDGARFLRQALDSILAQTYPAFELVVVDDASTDATAAILAEYAAADDRLVLDRSEAPLGLAAALRRGCALAGAPLIARMDADDIAFPDRLERQVALLAARPDVAAVGGAYVTIDADGRPLETVRYPTESAEIGRALTRYNCLAHPTVTMRRDALDAVGGYRRPVEDYDLWLRLAERFALANLAEPVLYYRRHAAQYSVAAIDEQALGLLAVKAAARERRGGRPDPLTGDTVVDRELLRRLGVDSAAVTRSVVAARVYWAETLDDAGDPAAASALRSDARSAGGRRAVASLTALERAKRARRQGGTMRAAALAAKSLLLDPRTVVRRARALA